jgi:hypothetical protein
MKTAVSTETKAISEESEEEVKPQFYVNPEIINKWEI